MNITAYGVSMSTESCSPTTKETDADRLVQFPSGVVLVSETITYSGSAGEFVVRPTGRTGNEYVLIAATLVAS